MVFMCEALRLRKRSRSPLHMKKRSCAATRAFPRLQAGAGALGAVSAPAQALAYPHCARIGRLRGNCSNSSEVYIGRNEILEHARAPTANCASQTTTYSQILDHKCNLWYNYYTR